VLTQWHTGAVAADSINKEIAAIARRAMEVALSHITVYTGDTLTLTVPLTGIQLPDDLTSLVRSVAESTGFTTSYSQDGLRLSWSNTGQPSRTAANC
jgi:hypothetical protein